MPKIKTKTKIKTRNEKIQKKERKMPKEKKDTLIIVTCFANFIFVNNFLCIIIVKYN